MRASIFCFVFICNLQLHAQYNSDWREVKRKHIKSAIAYTVYGNDTAFVRYNYDQKGFMISEEYCQWNKGHDVTFFDNAGEIGSVVTRARINMDTVVTAEQRVKARASIKYDTISRYTIHFIDLNYFNPFCCADSQFTYHASGADYVANVSWIKGDTMYSYYSLERGQWLPDGLTIRARIDSLENGFIYNHYLFSKSDTTLSRSEIVIFDQRGNPLTTYYYALPPAGCPMEKSGELYSPLGDTTFRLMLITYKNEYRPDGTLKRVTAKYHDTNKTETLEFGKARDGGVNSLEEINLCGTVVYEYFNAPRTKH